MKLSRGVAGVVSCLVVAGCAGSPTAEKKADAEATIFAAASLNTVLPELMQEQAPHISTTFNFDGSSGLVDQMAGGAPADVLLTANQKNMTKALDKGLVTDPVMFATNTLVMVVPKDNPGKVTGFTDGSLDGKRLVVCAPEVPCGSATAQLAELNSVTLAPASEEQSVTSVLGKVTSGEADAGLVYRTDAMLAGDKVSVIQIDQADKVVNKYMIAVASKAKNAKAAKAVIDAVMSDAGQKKLADFGFSAPIAGK